MGEKTERMKKKRKVLIVLLIILNLAAASVDGFLFFNMKSEASEISNNLDLGKKYLQEGNYEEALDAYKSIIAIDEKNVDAYLGAADVYAAMGMYEEAAAILKAGYDITGDQRLSEKQEELDNEINVSENEASEAHEVQEQAETEEPQEDIGMSFEELSNYSYYFSSGVGGWSDGFTISEDGTFEGYYYDSDMGDTGDGYPNGTQYFCDYKGRFEDIKKINDYTYSMRMTELTVTNDDQEFISDGVRYIPLYPYALDGADEILIYLPGTPVSELSEEVQMWLFIPYQDQQETLESLALVNVNEDYGICSSPYN